MRVGVISDTHGLLRREAVAALRGSDLIVHAGDIGRLDVLEQLRDLAPTHAVRGNIDIQPWARKLPDMAVVHAGRQRLFVAQVLQVTVDKDGAVKTTHVWCVVDCGLQVNPDTIRAQMESGIIFGLSAALHGEITIKDGRVEQTNFGDYRVLRINEAPKIAVTLVKSPEAPIDIVNRRSE